ncbi:MAG: hypothetical protein MUC56_08330 [Thermoanaerobaculales bacterium]|jgi:hypothetical protein|nr:hypothetical protein [Thermoanaerobaculales bacterium]
MELLQRRRWRGFWWPLFFVIVLVVQASRFPNLDQVKDVVRPVVNMILEDAVNRGRHWRLHWMKNQSGTTVSSLDVDATVDPESYTCNGTCFLLFLDLDPYAHYAHPTRILVLDSRPADSSSPVKIFEPTEWWPTVWEPSMPYPKSVFNTVSATDDPEHVLHLDLDGHPDELSRGRSTSIEPLTAGLVESGWSWVPVSSAVSPPPPPPTPTPGSGGAGTGACDTSAVPVWAILVNGYYDSGNTFDEDVSGMYAVLRSFQVAENRIKVLSSIDLEGVPKSRITRTSVEELWNEFESVEHSMIECVGALGNQTPHFLLFWSSHGTDETLYCDLRDGNKPDRQHVTGRALLSRLKRLESVWDSGELGVTVVIEACKSGSVGDTLRENGVGKRWILTSAGDGSSYRDIDEPLESVINNNTTSIADPNPADAGSETIWGYVEAYGSQASPTPSTGFLTFQDAVKYVKANDVTLLANNSNFPRDVKIHVPLDVGPTPVHGAWNVTERASSTVTLSALTSTAATTSSGASSSWNAPKGQPTRIKFNVENPGSAQEVGALALRLFRNDEASPNDWTPVYYEKDGILRTTVMVPGLAAGGDYSGEFEVSIPKDATVGDSIRLVAKLDSGQPWPATTQNLAATKDPTDEITLVVTKGEKKGLCAKLKQFMKDLFGS